MFDNVIMNNAQRKALEKSVRLLKKNGICGKIHLGKEFLNEGIIIDSCTSNYKLISGRVIYTAVVKKEDYVKAIEILDTPEILTSLAVIEVSHQLYDEGIIDDF